MKLFTLKVAVLVAALSIYSCKSASNSGSSDTSSDRIEASERRGGGDSQRGRQQGGKGGAPSASKIIAELDSNTDGKVSAAEAKGPLKENFSKIDTDGDGFLSQEEIENGKPQGGGGGRR